MQRWLRKRLRSGLVLRRRSLSKNFPDIGERSMRTKVKRRGRRRNLYELPLLDWADRRRRREPARSFAAREMQRQGAYSPATATLIARLAGLHVEDD
jgi:hypothetical protein